MRQINVWLHAFPRAGACVPLAADKRCRACPVLAYCSMTPTLFKVHMQHVQDGWLCGGMDLDSRPSVVSVLINMPHPLQGLSERQDCMSNAASQVAHLLAQQGGWL